jgi:hypothetical protein
MNFSQSFFAISFVAIAFFVVDIVGPGNIQAESSPPRQNRSRTQRKNNARRLVRVSQTV